MLAFPTDTAVTTPLADTVAVVTEEELHATVLVRS
jgi:hypothetical protein